ncbi:MAG: HAMP domain-containing sensor histidine kinase [bacterium]
MKKLKLQFILFFFLLALALGFLLHNSYRQMAIEEKSLWEGMSQKVFNQMQATISDFLTREDARSFTEYRYYQVLPAPGFKVANLTVSPLSLELPKEDTKGLLGYFQIDPDGSFSTPYLPRGPFETPPADSNERKEREKQIQGITQSLREEVLKDARLSQDNKKIEARAGEVEKEKKSADKVVSIPLANGPAAFGGSAQNVYPNPLQSPKLGMMAKAKKSDSAAEDALDQKKDEEAPAQQLARRQMAPSTVQLKTFEEQKQAEIPPPPAKPAPKAPSKEEMPEAASGASLAPVAPASPPPAEEGRLERLRDAFSGKKSKEKTAAGKGAPKPSLNLIEESPKKEPEHYQPTSILIDPFQARWVSGQYLLFYRKIWVEQKMYVQGFAVELKRFYRWMMEQSFANSDLTSFAWTELDLGGSSLIRYGSVEDKKKPILLFERPLGYPLNLFLWRVYAGNLPELSTRFYLKLFTGIIVLLGTGGLFLIYRSVSAQVKLSQKRQDFVSAVTHELKTPLTSIRMYSEMLEDGWVKEDGKRQEYYRHIHQESGRLSHLIDNVLQLARLEKRNYKLNLKKESPLHDFEQIGGELRKLAEQKGYTLAFQAERDLPPISYDPEAVKEVLWVLFDNSLKFSANGFEKTLEMSLFKEEEEVVWSWKDKGPGIPPAESKKVFEKFYRVENELTRRTKGTGIGLAMAKMIVEAMQGRIEARNREQGGLEVRMFFPAS